MKIQFPKKYSFTIDATFQKLPENTWKGSNILTECRKRSKIQEVAGSNLLKIKMHTNSCSFKNN